MATSITSRDPSLNEHTVRDSISVTSNNKEPISEKALEDATPKYDDSKILQGRKLALAFVAMLLSVLLIALDQTIIAPALPVIASQFSALNQISWIASAYFLTQCSFLLLYGSLLTIYDRKYVYLLSVVWFEIGSLFCAVAPSVNFLIFGRAVAGLGGAGIFVSVLSIIGEITRLEDRPKLFGLFGGVFGLSSILGPLLGGAFTDHVSWRWCFYINLPIGAVSVACICFIVPSLGNPELTPERIESAEAKFRRFSLGKWSPTPGSFIFRLGLIDYTGFILLLALVTCLLLGIQWGGDQYPWSSSKVIGLLCGFAVITVIFILWEWKCAGINAILPLRLFKSRTQVGTCLASCFAMFTMMGAIYYLPLLFQAVKHHSATRSGIDIIPFMLSCVIGSGIAGFIVSYTGNYWYFLVFAPWLASVGAGLLYTLKVTSPNSHYIGYQIILGFAVGVVLQNPIVAIQANVDPVDLPMGTALVTFTQLIGGVLGIAVYGTIFANELAQNLVREAPDAPFELIRHSVAAIYELSPTLRAGVINAYVESVDKVFLVGVACGALGSVSALLIRNLNIKGRAIGAGAGH